MMKNSSSKRLLLQKPFFSIEKMVYRPFCVLKFPTRTLGQAKKNLFITSY